MTHETTLRQAGGSISATIPKSCVVKYRFEAGDKVFLKEVPEGLLLTPYDPDVEEGLAIVAEMSRTYRNAMRELAK